MRYIKEIIKNIYKFTINYIRIKFFKIRIGDSKEIKAYLKEKKEEVKKWWKKKNMKENNNIKKEDTKKDEIKNDNNTNVRSTSDTKLDSKDNNKK